eukprot:GHVU01167957.1.p2 GENE.GHVU01167957.1~~GHVU01167957.1.p2  ORF type:complete len:113 (-),score=3.68 GHVU01167957.1:146-484(-)
MSSPTTCRLIIPGLGTCLPSQHTFESTTTAASTYASTTGQASCSSTHCSPSRGNTVGIVGSSFPHFFPLSYSACVFALHAHRLSTGTSESAVSMCFPHPAQVGFEQPEHCDL